MPIVPQTLSGLVGLLILVAVAAAAFFVGGRRERMATLGFLSAVFVTLLAQETVAAWNPVWLLMTVDSVVLAVFGAIAWRPRRGWPLWLVGLQGLIVAIDGLRAAEVGVGAGTYFAALDVVTCFMTAVIAYAGWAAWRRRGPA